MKFALGLVQLVKTQRYWLRNRAKPEKVPKTGRRISPSWLIATAEHRVEGLDGRRWTRGWGWGARGARRVLVWGGSAWGSASQSHKLTPAQCPVCRTCSWRSCCKFWGCSRSSVGRLRTLYFKMATMEHFMLRRSCNIISGEKSSRRKRLQQPRGGSRPRARNGGRTNRKPRKGQGTRT